MKAPLIAITPWLRDLPTPLGKRTRLYSLDPAYAARIADGGGIPRLITQDTAAHDALDGAKGLLLSGGGDIAPSTYGEIDTGGCEDVDLLTDAWELGLIAEARTRRLPTLGICRGMQMLAVAHGGKLAQDVDPVLHPGMGALPPAELLARRHLVEVAPESIVASVFCTTRLRVNTLHHQVVSDPGTMAIVARAADGTIEALVAPDWPAVGVQWHPEKMEEPEQNRLFRYLIDSASAAHSG